MVAVEVRDEHRTQLQRVDAAAEHLLLRALSRIDKVVLLVAVYHL